jgi:geranylgeranylglycerol-phosphate geranylgeranyltransferase
MNIFCLLTLLCFTNVVSRSSYLYMKKNMSDKFSFLYKFTHLYKPHPIIKNDNHYLNILQEKNPQHIFLSKIKSYLRLIRYKNIIPTLGLSYTGAFLVNPSFYTIITSKNLLISTLIIIGTMSSSMIMNDLFDMKIDKINNPTRPLITGEVSEKEAHILNAFILLGVEILNMLYLPRKFQNMIHLILFSLFIYTPKIKKMTFLKNIYCASIVSFSTYFSAMVYSSSLSPHSIQNIHLLKLFSQTIFFGSLFNEILLDIRDREGDYVNEIKTLPVIYGNSNALVVASGILKMNFMWNMYRIIELFGLKYVLFVPFIFLPIMYGVKKIRKYDYNPSVVIETTHIGTKSLLLVLVYYCFMAKTKKF